MRRGLNDRAMVYEILSASMRQSTGFEFPPGLVRKTMRFAGRPARIESSSAINLEFQTRGARRGDRKNRGPITHTRLRRVWRMR